MKKLIKKRETTFDRKVNITVDKRLDKLDLKALAPQKLAEANRRLKKLRSLPK